MSSQTLYDKIWDLHRVRELTGGSTQLFVGLHLIHEVTSPQAFAAREEKGLRVHSPDSPSSTSHIGAELKEYRSLFHTTGEFVKSLSKIKSYEQFKQVLEVDKNNS